MLCNSSAIFKGYCEVETYEEALELFTLKGMKNYIGFMAIPQFAVFENMAQAGDCPHHHPITVNGKSVGGQYEYTFTNQHISGSAVTFDIGGTEEERFRLDAPGRNDYGGLTKTRTRTTSSVRFAFSGIDSWYTENNGTVIFTNAAP
jgi:hypothetical protein